MSGESGTESFAITPNDTTTYQTCRGLWVGTGGDVTLIHRKGGSTATFANVQDGTMLDVQHEGVMLTGTTASNLRGVI